MDGIWLLLILATVAALAPETIQLDCGHANPDSAERIKIVGGDYAREHEFPWMVYVERHYQPHNHQQDPLIGECDGTLINDQWIVSAGHCFRPIDGYTLTKVTVTVGLHNLRMFQETGRRTVTASRWITHPKYDYRLGTNAKADITLVQLSEKLDLSTRYVSPICLPGPSNADITNASCMALGWGRIGFNQPISQILKKVEQNVHPLQECHRYWPEMDATQICAGVQNRGTCNGDSGGPLQCLHSTGSGNVWALHGVVSYGAVYCTQKPGVFTNVSSYTEWIETTIR